MQNASTIEQPTIRVFDVLKLLDPGVVPERTKIHLATWNGFDQPLDVYFRGEFDDWQCWQSRCNFQRPHVLSLISMPGTDRWLFAGLYDSHGCAEVNGVARFRYQLEERAGTRSLSGRLITRFSRLSRQSYLNAERWADQLLLDEIRSEPLSISDFPGYRHVNLSYGDLRLIVRQEHPSWQAALSNVGGVYLISDARTGDLYVGSAAGVGGFWGRWSQYAATGHGGNVELRRLLLEGGAGREEAFRYSILEIMDVQTSANDVLQRESWWKKILGTRTHGLNAN